MQCGLTLFQNREASKLERKKLSRLRKEHGIYPFITLLNFAQMPMHMVFISMINRVSYNQELLPGITSEGMLWFSDLSVPDPTGILPIMGGVCSMITILSNRTMTANSSFSKAKRYFILMPLLSVPIQMTFPAVSKYH